MPFVQFQTNQPLDEGGAEAVALELSKRTAEILGKPESYVQVLVEGAKTISFGASMEPSAFITLNSLGLDQVQAAEFSKLMCSLAEERFSIPADRIYLKMADHPRAFWGWNGGTFE